MIDTVPCDQGCGAQLFRFADVITCPECTLRLERAAMLDADKAVEWDEAMRRLDGLPVKWALNPCASLVSRLDDLWRQVCE